ncbi:cell division protein FtsL [uncultured Cocleimonas sp.]|uniref:cell division protein FtsL n=1 Tax=uncultured Cocleimonas sp. TaxID=1051587 RepID=UPI00260E3151|nr:cell division protein FtsL [uncultured Cocleimonas sp.]
MSIQDPVEVNAANKQVTVDSVTNWQLPLLAVLFVSIVFVAIKTVVQRHESRTAYMKLQTLEKERDKLAAQWSRLKLEQGTALNQVRVEQYARWDLEMKIPKASEIRIVREPQAVIDEVVSSKAMVDHKKLSKVSLSD